MFEVVYNIVNLTSHVVLAWLSKVKHFTSMEITTIQLRDYVTGIKMAGLGIRRLKL